MKRDVLPDAPSDQDAYCDSHYSSCETTVYHNVATALLRSRHWKLGLTCIRRRQQSPPFVAAKDRGQVSQQRLVTRPAREQHGLSRKRLFCLDGWIDAQTDFPTAPPAAPFFMAPPTMPLQDHSSMAAVLPAAPRGGLRFDRRLLLVYGLLLLDVIVIGSTSLQHVWQPANLIDKVLQNHSTPLDAAALSHSHAPQQHLPVAVKRELGMSCCCGWLALAVMGTLSLLLSYSPSATRVDASPPSSTAASRRKGQTPVRRSRTPTAQTKEANTCSSCSRTLDEVELQVKLKYLLVAVATFCVFFALNLVVQVHGRFQQSKVTVTALKTLAADSTEGPSPSPGHGLYDLRQGSHQHFDFPNKRDQGLGVSGASSAAAVPIPSLDFPEKAAEPLQVKDMPDTVYSHEDDGSAHPQSPPYFYWRDFFFWMELGRECFFDGEIQLSGLWVLLHAATLLGGRRALHSRSLVFPRIM